MKQFVVRASSTLWIAAASKPDMRDRSACICDLDGYDVVTNLSITIVGALSVPFFFLPATAVTKCRNSTTPSFSKLKEPKS